MDFENLTIDQLDAELDRRDALRRAGEAYDREETKAVMAIRNRKIASRELYAREHPTPVVGLPNQDRLAVLRAKAGVAEVSAKLK